MAVPILEAAEIAAAAGTRLTEELDHVATRWYLWHETAPDVGAQTRQVLYNGSSRGAATAASLRAAARELHERTGRTGGNGSLMRSAPIPLAHLGDDAAIAAAAREVSDLTHPEPDAASACVLWCVAAGHAVVTGDLDVRRGLPLLAADQRARWAGLLDEAEREHPTAFPRNGWVVHAAQAAWASVHTARGTAEPLRRGLENAVRAGHDTDTVAAIAGMLLGAAYGASAVPTDWVPLLHGWPGITGTELADRAEALAAGSVAARD
jgi:ADP-ribosylglycohydrolase